jgi:hypothetical protein
MIRQVLVEEEVVDVALVLKLEEAHLQGEAMLEVF